MMDMDDALPRLRWHRVTPDRLVLGLLAVEAFLLLTELQRAGRLHDRPFLAA
jgi:hypothetical protein